MLVTDALLGHLGITSGKRVHFAIDYIKRNITLRQAFG
jgi:hypothetical protein